MKNVKWKNREARGQKQEVRKITVIKKRAEVLPRLFCFEDSI